MIDPRELLKGRQAPMPVARPMPTEIRSDGGLKVQLLQAPYWAGPDGNPVIAEWRCFLSLKQLLDLRDYLVRPDADTGIQPEAAIDQALKDSGIGAYLGTFVTEGPTFNEVRFMFALRPNESINTEALNRRLFNLLSNASQGAKNLRYLRDLWASVPVRSDAKLMMLSQTDLLGSLSDPEQSPFTADQFDRI